MSSLENTKILLVDDSNTVLTIIKKALAGIGIKKIATAQDGEEALLMLQREAETEPFDLILCDWIMPELSGIDLLKLIRESHFASIARMRFIMITGANEKVKEAMESGADNFISKPFSADDLRKKLEFVLR
jgi:two-component system chemotaxis response regulator CheY